MKSGPLVFTYVETPSGVRITFLGAEPVADGASMVLRAPNGRPLLRVPAAWCRRSSEAEFARRVLEDARAVRSEREEN